LQFLCIRIPPISSLFPYTTLFRSVSGKDAHGHKKLSDELARGSDSFATAATHPDEPAFWLYSSGSTGMPKGVRHPHSNLAATARSEEHTSELQSRFDLVCRLLLEK